MSLNADLSFAISASGGGKISLIMGAGCSVESPTNIPVASICSLRLHQRLVADGILVDRECPDPSDLGILADTVYKKTGKQAHLVIRMLNEYPLKLASPNEGHKIAAALLLEGAIGSIVTLNYDLAIVNALSFLGGASEIGIVESPEQSMHQRGRNIYFLHRSANESDFEKWVLRTPVLADEWRDHWEEMIATKVLANPIVIFAGLGSPIAVLLESINRLRLAIPLGTKVFQVDRSKKDDSLFYQKLKPAHFIREPWSKFMCMLAARLVEEHVAQLSKAIERKIAEDALTPEDATALLQQLSVCELVESGAIRSNWLLEAHSYHPQVSSQTGLLADLILGVAMLARVSGTEAVIKDNGTVEFLRSGRITAVVIVASGQGHRGRNAVEALLSDRHARHNHRQRPRSAIVFGTSDTWNMPAPPSDLVRGEGSEEDILGSNVMSLIHIAELRTSQLKIAGLIP